MNWREVASELGLSPSFFTRLRDGSEPDARNLCLLCDWLGGDVTIDSFRVPVGTRVPGPRLPHDDELFVSLPADVIERTTQRALDTSDAPVSS